MKRISVQKAVTMILVAVLSAILLVRFLPAVAATPASVLGMATSRTPPLSYEPAIAQPPLSEFVSGDTQIGASQHLSSPEGRSARRRGMERTCPITMTASPVFWDTPPQSGPTAIVSGQEVIRPGLEDEIRVIIQLQGEPVAAYKSRLRQVPARLTEVQREQVQAYAEEVQEAHRQAIAEIQQLGIPFQMRREYGYIFNGLSASIEMQDMKRMEALPQVKAVYPDYQVRALLDDSVPLIGADEVWDMGMTGAGTEVAILDTGIDYTHPDLGGCFGTGCKVVAGYDFVNGDADPWDDAGHGTHCAGIVAANGSIEGVAPDASLHAYKVLDEYGSGWDSDIIAAIEQAVDPDGNPATDDAVDVISMSLGGGGDPDEPLALAVDAAVDEGVVVAVAAGNSGSDYQTIESPGVARKAFTVGATDKSDNIAYFSSRGPVTDFYELTKPEIVAPGYYINSTYPGGGYVSMSGTSMATPHIAGAVALIKQLHPTWTPAMIQANLMNRAKDLDLDIYTQGAGRVQVDDAASVQAVLMPGAVSFGMVDVSQPVWTETETLQLTNVSAGSVDYSLQVSGDLPAGVTTSLDPASVTLGAGESVDIAFQITVDNALTPYQNQEPGAYEGQVIAQPTVAAQIGVQGVGNPLVMPFAFIKSPVLEITFDESPWIVLIYDGEQRRAERYYPPTVSTFLLPEGTYDVWVIYGPPDTWVIREGVVVSGEGTSLSITRSDAAHTVTLDPRDKDGQPISPGYRLLAQQFTHTPSGYWIGITWRGTSVPLTYHLSDASADYSWEWRLDTGWNDAYYEFNDRLTGISGDVTYQNAPGDLWHIRHVCHPGPAFSQVRLGFHPPYGGGWRTSAVAEMVLSAPFVQDAYYIPFDPDFYYSDLYLEVRDPSTSDTLINSPFYLIKEGHEVEAYVPWTWDPVLTTTGNELHLGQAPPHWFGEFANSETEIIIEPAVDSYAPLFLNQGADRQPYDEVPYTLYQSGSVVASGNLPAASDYWDWMDPVVIPLSSTGAYSLEIMYDQYWVNSQPGQARVVADFDTSQADKDPPTLLTLNVFYDGETASLVPPSAASEVRFRVQDSLSQVSLFYRDNSNWIAAALTSAGDEYTAELPGFANGTYVSLKIVAEDTSGNSLTYEATPAFEVAMPSPAREVCGEVSGTWTAAESPYIVTCDITVTVGSVLTIEPGVEVRFATDDASNSGEYTDRTELTVMGTLLAQGTSAQPISFTSASETPAPGDWGQIKLDDASSSSAITYSRIEHATRGILANSTAMTIAYNTITQNSQVGVLAQWAPSVIISNTITENGGNGLHLLYSHSTVDGNQITDNSGNGIHLFYYSSPNITHNTITGNDANGIHIQMGSYEARPRINYNTIVGNAGYGICNENIPDIDATNNEWGTTDPVQIANAIYDFNDNPDSGLVAFSSATVTGEEHISGNVTWSGTHVIDSHIWIDPGATLIIQAGAQVRFADYYGFFNQGTLLVQGTSAAPVIFTTNSVTPMPGAWAMIKFNFAEGTVDYAQIQYARRGLFMYHSSPTVSNSLVANSLESGILAHMSSNADLNNDTITDNGAHGLYLLLSDPTVVDTTISRNGGSGIWAFYSSSPVVTYSRLTDNSGDGFTVQGHYASQPRINYSSLYGNGGYCFRHDNSTDIDATYNYWGTTNPTIIEGCIYDHNDNASLGTVDFSNYTEIPQSEYEALVALYNSTDGANWSNNSGWMETDTPCSWYGVTCSAGHVTELSLNSNQLSGSIPVELGNLTDLQYLSLGWNQLTGSIPPELGNLANLQYLALCWNPLSGNIPPELSNLTNLQSLYLNYNQLTGSIPPELGNLANLEGLYLIGNELSGSIPPELGNLTDLQYLYLYDNQLTSNIPPDLGNLANLQSLSLSWNQLSASIPPELGSLTNLEELELDNNQLSGSIPLQLCNLSNLQVLCLDGNQLSGSIPVELGNLTNLQVLWLGFNQLSGSIPIELGNLTNLHDLRLDNNQLTGSIPPELGNLTDLQFLHLDRNQLSGSIPPGLSNLTNLQELCLHINQLSGSIPPELGNLASSTWLWLDRNQLSGSIPPELGNLTNLQNLYLYSNQLSGSIPTQLGNLANLQYLRLDDNQLSGALPGTLTNLVNLDTFWFHDTDLCEPADAAFQAWLAGISDLESTGVICPGPGLPYTVTLVAYPTSLTVGNTSSLTATVKDLYDNNVADGTIVTFTTNLGSVGSQSVTKTTTSGVAMATLTSQEAGTASVTAMADSKYDTAYVTFNPGPPSPIGKRIQVPRIDKEGEWTTRIQMQNVGDAQTGVITLFWEDYSGACPSSDPGPVDHSCQLISGNWGTGAVTADIPIEAKSAIVYSVSDELFESACEAAGNIDGSEAWMNWEATYAYSGEPLAVTVDRRTSNGSSASGTYNGFSETMLGSGPPYTYFASHIVYGYDGLDSTITIQNAGEVCTSAWLYYKEEDNCEYMKVQHIEMIAPGEAIRIGPGPDANMPYPGTDAGDPGVAPWLGSAYITANEPLAVVVDRWDADFNMLLTHAGVLYPDYGATTNYAPLVYRELDGWNAEIHVQNLTQNSEPTFVTVEFFDQNGDSILFVGTWVCRNGTHTFDLLDIVDLGINYPSGYVGAAEIQSHDQVDYPGQSLGEPIASVISLINSNGSEALSYNAFTPQQVAGVTTFALPRISKQSEATSRIVIRNNSNCNKFYGEIWLWDESGTVVAIIPTPWLHPKHLKLFDLADFGQIAPGFAGAATFEVLDVEQLCDMDGDGYADDEPIMPSVIVLHHGDSASGQEAFPVPSGAIISEVQVTNARDTSFAVSWVTNQAATGEVRYGTDPEALDQTAYDDRGAGTSDDTHHATLTGLAPETTYYFDVVSGGTTDDNDSAHYTVTTGPTLGLPGSDTIYGQVFEEDGMTLAEGTIVYITLQDADGNGSPDEAATLSALVDDTGYWTTNLGNARTADLGTYFSYSASGDRVRLEAQGAADGTGCLLVDTADDSPAADLILDVSTCITEAEIPLQIGWNHISLPLEPLTPYTAEGVCIEIGDQGGDVAEIDRWYASGWDGHICGLPFNDFDIELGSDYFVLSDAVSNWTIEGYEVTTPVPLDLQIGWNSIGVPHCDTFTAQSLCDEIIGQGVTAIEIDRWYASGWDGHICGLPFNDFAIEIGKGYFVKAASAGVVTPICPVLSTLASPLPLPQEVPLAARKAQPRIENVRMTNLRDTSFAVSWTTDREASGYLEFADGRVFYDVRGKGFAGETHYVVVTGLAPKTTYLFDVHSGATVDDEAGKHYTIATLPTLDTLPDSDAVYGQVLESDGVTPAEGAIVYLTLRDADGAGSPGDAGVMTTLVDADGWWQANLGNARLADGTGYFTYSAAGDAVVLTAHGAGGGLASRTVDTGDLGPAKPLTLVRQRQPYLPLVVEE